MRPFDGADARYLAWVDANRRYVVNALRRATPDYLILQRATCTSISRTPSEPIRWTSGSDVKSCVVALSELERWARETAGGALSPCGMCRPV